MSRPEDNLPPELYYNDREANKYTSSSRIRNIQATMTHRALELLDLQQPSYILDIGCGSGLSGEILTQSGKHIWTGFDISSSMLGKALSRDTVEGDMLLADAGQGIPFRAGTFDAAISISAIQWLCNADSNEPSGAPEQRLRRFFDGLYASLRRGARAVCQFYPRDARQREMISSAAVRAGFGAGILEDDPDTKNVKVYLVLTVGGADVTGAVEGLSDVDVQDRRRAGTMGSTAGEMGMSGRRGVAPADRKGSKAWILRKKAQMEAKGKVVRATSKYTGRKRKTAF